MSRPIRVLSLVGELLLGGGESRLLSLARSIDRLRFEHRIVVIHRANGHIEKHTAMARQYADAGIEVHEFENYPARPAHGLSAKAKVLAKRVRGIMQLIERHNIDVIDAHMETAALVATIAGSLTRRRVCVTLYHPEPLVRPRFWSFARQWIFMAADLVITDSEARAEEIRQAAMRQPRVCVVPNGVWVPLPARTDREIRTLLRIPSQARVVGQIGAFIEFKGQLILLEAARRVLNELPDVYFVFVGYSSNESNFRAKVEAKALELGIAEHVRILNYPGPIGDIWQIIDIHVHASLFDSLPQAILEGMSLAKPAVVTAVGGVPEAVVNGHSGLVVQPGDSAALASGILQLLRDPALSRKLGDAAFVRYKDSYRPELTARKLEACFETVVS